VAIPISCESFHSRKRQLSERLLRVRFLIIRLARLRLRQNEMAFCSPKRAVIICSMFAEEFERWFLWAGHYRKPSQWLLGHRKVVIEVKRTTTVLR
jgi:hypothetical protein